MKCEILKRTAIALFVGGVISTYAMAEDKPIETAASTFGKAIDAEVTKQTEAVKAELTKSIAEKADKSAVSEALNKLQTEKASLEDVTKLSENVTEGFNSIQDKVHNLQEALAGDGTENNPGLIKSVSSAVEELNDNIAKKADQSAVDDINAELDARAKALETLQKEKASLEDVTKLSENVTEGFNSIQDKVHNLQEALAGDGTENNPGLIKSVSSAVEELNDNIAKKADKATVEQNTKEIEKIKNLQGYDSLTKVENKVKELVSEKADNQALEALKQEVKDNEEGIGKLSETVSDIDDNVDNLTDAHNKLLEEHNNLVEDVKGFNDAYNKFTDDVHAELDEKANASDVYTKTESDSKLDAKANASDVYTKAESNSKLDAKANVSDVYTKAESNSKLDAKANVSDVYTKAESNSKLNAKANASEVYTKTESNSKLDAKANVADVYSKTETDNKFALKADNSVVSAHTKRLDHLDNRVNKLDKDLKRGLATQAALTGLFQPYTVGKANFTAAVGGYKSQTAVAIGTGYRYNKHVATKAGVAFTQGGAAYNVGVNFEW